MKSTLNRNLAIGFGFSLLLLLASSVASYLSIDSLLSSSEWVNHTYEVIAKLDHAESKVKEAESSQRGYLLSGDQLFLEPYSLSHDEAMRDIQDVKRLTTDNVSQQRNVETLNQLISRRFFYLRQVIDEKKQSNQIDLAKVKAGKFLMDSVSARIDVMKDEENGLLIHRTSKYNKLSSYTPIIIILASMLAILVSLIFYLRVRKDVREKAILQDDLLQKDEGISRRIVIIRGIAEKISSGEYGTRVQEDERDNLGSLGGSLNRMAQSLDDAFQTLKEKEWMQSGLAAANEAMVGEKKVEQLATDILDQLTRFTDCQVGAFYLADSAHNMRYIAGYAFAPNERQQWIPAGSGIVGQCAVSGREMLIKDIPEENMLISFATGKARPSAIIAIPVFFEKTLKAVIEMGAVHDISEREISFLKGVAYNIGIAINTSESRTKLQELFEETQSQSEELQAQHSELENMNAEMETQTEKLQASEEELKVQQEELMQTNIELEERSKLLEEKNILISERNTEIQKKAEELAVSTRYKSEFLANMSHELRTPLNSILLLSRLMSENAQRNLTPDQVEYAQVIQSSGNGLLQLIDEILDLSKIEAGKMELEYGFMNLREELDTIRKMFEPLARDKQIEFTVNIDPAVPMDIETDRMRMGQVIKNLLSNAFKFTSKGFVHLDVKPDEAESGFIRILVADSGMGIPRDKQGLIFEAFQQADGSTKRKFGGTGLGLSISRELSRLLKGDLTVESEEDKGSIFCFRIPATLAFAGARPLPAPTIPLAAPVTEKVVPENKIFTTDKIPGDIPDDRDDIRAGDKVILIVEDDTAFAGALLEYTRSQHYKGVVAVRGDHALPLARAFTPLGILLDIQLPVRSGWEVMDELKQDPATRHIPVHMMSSFEAKKESISKGAIDFINKPVAYEQMADVFKKIEYVLSRASSKVLIVEENSKHAQALGYFLSTYHLTSVISKTIAESIESLRKTEVNCVILDMGADDAKGYEMLEAVKKAEGLENIPIILFTGKNFSRNEEQRIRQFADSIVVKTAHSYQRILDEVSLFLHIVNQPLESSPVASRGKLAAVDEVLANKMVLIANDDVRNIYSLTKILEHHKMKIIPAIDGQEALRMMRANPGVNIVLMDMMMPELDGFEAIRAIRQTPEGKKLPIIAVTAKAMAGDREKCIQAGASDYISKPVDVDQLISLLRIWLYEK